MQGAGKSTVAKLVSTFSWLEKALIRGDFSKEELSKYHRFQNKYCAYHNVHHHFKMNTILKYTGIVGDINKSDFYQGIPSDNNFLNNSLEESDAIFSTLLKLEQQCQ